MNEVFLDDEKNSSENLIEFINDKDVKKMTSQSTYNLRIIADEK